MNQPSNHIPACGRQSHLRFQNPRRLLAPVVGLMLGSVISVAAQNQKATFSETGGIITGNYANRVQVVGDIAYVADGLEGVKIVNVGNPAAPMLLGSFATGGDARDLAVVGNRAYVATGAPGLRILDVSDPATPTSLGIYNTVGLAGAVQVVGNLAYVADGLAGLQIIDVADAANPVRVGFYNTSGEAVGIHVVGDTAYVADGYSGLQILDVSDPATPQRRGGFNSPDYAKAVQVVGNRAYLADGFSGLQILDLSDPLSPSRISAISEVGGQTYGVTVEGNHAYVSDLRLGLLLYDVSVPASPVLLGQVGTGTEGYTTQLVGDRIFLANGLAGLKEFGVRLGIPQELMVQGDLGETVALNVAHPFGATSSGGLPVTVSVRGPAALGEGTLTVTNLGLVTVELEQAGNAQYLPARRELRFNVPVVTASRVGSFTTPDWAEEVQVVGNLAYVAAGLAGLQVIDVSAPASPVRVGGLETTGHASAVAVVGNVAYVAAAAAGLEIIEVSNLAAPVLLGSFDTPGQAEDVKVVGNLAFVADWSSGLIILDVSNPSAPVQVGGLDTPGGAVAVRVVGDLAYVADADQGLVVIDVSNPAAPVRRGGLGTANWIAQVEVVGGLAYLSSRSTGVQVVDVTDPAAPKLLSSIRTAGAAQEVQVVGQRAYVACDFSGLEVLDLSDPTRPISIGSFNTIGFSLAVQVVGNLAFLADGSGGLQVVELRIGQPQSLGWNFPAELFFTGLPLPLNATTTSGLPLSYSVLNGPATVAGDQLMVTGTGRITVRVQQPGDTAYASATAERTFTVGLPRLDAQLAGPAQEVSWAAGLAGITLHGRESLAAETPWQEVTLPWVTVDGKVRVNTGDSPFRFFRLHGFSGLVEPLELAGWNRDVVLENQPGRKAAAIDSFGAVWFESGLGGNADGFPTNRQIVSALDGGVRFALQPYTSSNALWLNVTLRTNSLSLVTPGAYGKLHVLAHSAGGGGDGSVKVHYADGSASAPIPFFAPDWWDGSPDLPTRRPAIAKLARSRTAFAFNYDPVWPGFSLHQTDIDLSTGPDAGKVVTRLEFVKGASPEVTVILAVSGIAIAPNP